MRNRLSAFTFLLVLVLAVTLRPAPAHAQDGGQADSARVPIRLAGPDELGPRTAYGEVPDSLLNLRPSDLPSFARGAPWLYAHKELYVTFDDESGSVVAVLHHIVRIKVFDASAREASVVSIPWYFDQEMEQIQELRAATWHPDGSRVALADSGRRVINVNARYNIMEFTMPDVTDGSVLEYSYKVRRRYIQELPEFYFSHPVPTLLAQVSVEYPAYLRYAASVENFPGGGSPEHRVERVDTSSVPRVFTFERPEPVTLEHWTARNLSAVREESYITSVDDYRAQVHFQISEFGLPRQPLENSWEFVVAELRRKQDILGRIASYDRARKLGAEIALAAGGGEAARDSIYRYLNGRVNYSGSSRASSAQGDSLVLEGVSADQAAINQTLTAMLRGAGIEAWPLLISTRTSGQLNRSFPSFYQFNAQLTWAADGDSSVIMDASFPHAQPGLIPVPMYNQTGLLLRGEDYQWVSTNPSGSVFAIDIQLEGELLPNGDLRGRVEASSAGYPKQTIRRRLSEGALPEEVIRQALFEGYGEISLSGSTLEGADDYDRQVRMRSEFRIPGYARSFTDALEYPPMVVGYLMSNPFESSSRDLPVTLDAPERLNLAYEIHLPDGWRAAGREEGGRSLELDGAWLQEEYRLEGNTLRYGYDIDISRIKFRKEQFPQLIRLYERWVELSNSAWQIHRN
ncbi:MAG: DUF3857 domain-containing protein [Balneolaceae bacterium]|nr:DUF3857 domain-containing protein [Balneolaceae bacterium]